MPFTDRLRAMIPLGLKTGLARAVFENSALNRLVAGADGVVTVRGLTIDLSGGFEHQASAVRFGMYERAELYMARRFILPEVDVIELGASLGIVSCNVAQRLTTGRLIAVEADPDLARRARANLNRNGFDAAAVIQAAIDYSGAETVSFGSTDHLSGQVGHTGQLSVPAVTLSQLLKQYDIGTFQMVADIEGAELAMFLADPTAFARCRRLMIEMDGAELAGNRITVDEEVAIIEQLGFRCIYRHANCATFEKPFPDA